MATQAQQKMDISVVGFVANQDPNDDDDGWATSLEIKGSIQGKEVSQLLEKQRRVLRSAMEGLTSKKALALLTNGRNKISKELLRAITSGVKKSMAHYARAEFGRGVKVEVVDYSEDDTYWTAKINPAKEGINFELEVSVSGEWK